uniref:Peptidase metallopeptidase domain-containing protein n=1 Tax=Oryza punctata TaxID=4537 RepID=A0A0E0MAM3_ORYPU
MFLLCGTTSQPAPTTTLQPRPEEDNNSGGAAFTFMRGKPRWTRPDMLLKYAVSPMATVDHLPRDAVREAFRSAFARWADVIPVRFVEACYDTADIKIGFYLHTTDDKCDACGYIYKDGGEVLAHAYPPPDGRIHMHAARKWTVNLAGDTAPPLTVDLESVAVHEIGHVLGLGHSSSKSSVMYKHYREGKVCLTDDDVNGVQELYGANPLRLGLTVDSKPKKEIEQHIQQKKETAEKKSSFWRRGLISCFYNVMVSMVSRFTCIE